MRFASLVGAYLLAAVLLGFTVIVFAGELERILLKYITVRHIISFFTTAWAWLTGKYNL